MHAPVHLPEQCIIQMLVHHTHACELVHVCGGTASRGLLRALCNQLPDVLCEVVAAAL